MVPTLRLRFLAAETHFLSAFTSGKEALSAFDDVWTSLLMEFTAASEAHKLDEETLAVAHTIASRIAILAETLSALDLEVDGVCHRLKADVDRVLMHPVEKSSSPEQARKQFPRSEQGLDVTASSWLLRNIDDPYPSSRAVQDIAEACRCSTHSVRDWFSGARRSIGWTTLLRERFEGSRRLASEAASRAYTNIHDLPADTFQAFMAIKANVHALTPDAVLSAAGDAGPEDVSGLITPLHDTRPGKDIPRAQLSAFDLASSSPGWNPYLVDSQSDFSSEEEDIIPPPPIAGSKRRFDESLESMADALSETSVSDVTVPRPLKRHRATTPLSSCKPRSPLIFTLTEGASARYEPAHNSDAEPGSACFPPSPERQTFATDASTALTTPDSLIAGLASCPPPLVSTRKRRLSDTGPINAPKRPQTSALGPRQHAASAPFSINPAVYVSDEPGTNWAHWSPGKSIPSDTSACTFPGLFNIESGDYAATDVSVANKVLPALQVDVPSDDLAEATPEGFDFSTLAWIKDFIDSTSQSQSLPLYTDSDDSITSSPTGESLPDLSDFGPMVSYLDWTAFEEPPSLSGVTHCQSRTSFPERSIPFQFLDDDSSVGTHDIVNTSFGIEPPFMTSDVLSSIDDLSSIPIPLETVS